MLPLTLLSFAASFVLALGAGSAWLAGASDFATWLLVVAGAVFASSIAVTIATRIMMSVLAARDPQLNRALKRLERDALRPPAITTVTKQAHESV